jgi:hypothetical protein
VPNTVDYSAWVFDPTVEAAMELPAFFEVTREGCDEAALVPVAQVLTNAELRREVVTSLLAAAARLEAQAEQSRQLAQALQEFNGGPR